MKKPTLQQIANNILENEFILFTDPYDVNLGGIRTKDNESNTFNDWLYCFHYDQKGQIQGVVVPGTTDAGLFYRLNPMNVTGTAIIQHGIQHRGAYQLQDPNVNPEHRGHRGIQKAFRQVKPMKYWRDANRDKYLDFDGPTLVGVYHTNGHYMGKIGKEVNKWSAGCWGATIANLNKIFAVAERQINHGLGDFFSFTLMHEKDFLL